jgi:hypothetical protein
MKTLQTIVLAFLLSSFLISSNAFAACNAVTVSGCGSEEKICVDHSDATSSKTKAVEAFNDKNACDKSTAKGEPAACDSVKCDLRVGA